MPQIWKLFQPALVYMEVSVVVWLQTQVQLNLLQKWWLLEKPFDGNGNGWEFMLSRHECGEPTECLSA